MAKPTEQRMFTISKVEPGHSKKNGRAFWKYTTNRGTIWCWKPPIAKNYTIGPTFIADVTTGDFPELLHIPKEIRSSNVPDSVPQYSEPAQAPQSGQEQLPTQPPPAPAPQPAAPAPAAAPAPQAPSTAPPPKPARTMMTTRELEDMKDRRTALMTAAETLPHSVPEAELDPYVAMNYVLDAASNFLAFLRDPDGIHVPERMSEKPAPKKKPAQKKEAAGAAKGAAKVMNGPTTAPPAQQANDDAQTADDVDGTEKPTLTQAQEEEAAMKAQIAAEKAAFGGGK